MIGDIYDAPFAFQVHARIGQIKDVEAGEGVGYDIAYTCQTDRKIALIHIGYGDGYNRDLGWKDTSTGERAYMVIGGYKAPVVGAISMNFTCVDVTEIPENILNQAQYAEVIGENVDVRYLASCAGTVPEDLLITLGNPNVRVDDRVIEPDYSPSQRPLYTLKTQYSLTM